MRAEPRWRGCREEEARQLGRDGSVEELQGKAQSADGKEPTQQELGVPGPEDSAGLLRLPWHPYLAVLMLFYSCNIPSTALSSGPAAAPAAARPSGRSFPDYVFLRFLIS